ncbi:MAG: hypothetical protein JXQ87_08480 [Bacteroidia bacterium]
MKKVFFMALLGLACLGFSCSSNDLTITITADKSEVAIGETITFTATVSSSEYTCADWTIYKDIEVATEIASPAGSSTFTYTPTEAGNYQASFSAGYECDGERPVGSIDEDVFEEHIDFTVTE